MTPATTTNRTLPSCWCHTVLAKVLGPDACRPPRPAERPDAAAERRLRR